MKRSRRTLLVTMLFLTVWACGCTAPVPGQTPERTTETTAETLPREEAARLEQLARADAGFADGYYAGSIYDVNMNRLCWTGIDANGEAYREYDKIYEESLSVTFDNATGGLRKRWGSILTKRNKTPCGFADDTGQSLQTYMDADLILRLYTVMTDLNVEGAVCIMNVSDNTVMAIAASNGYSPTALQLDETYQMPEGAVNRAFQNLPPGSTMKMLSAPIADMHEISTLTDTDEWEGIHNSDFWSGSRYTKEISLYAAIVKSSNVYFAKVFDLLGIETVVNDLASFFALSDDGIECDCGYLVSPGCVNIADGTVDNLRRSAFGQGRVRMNLLYLSAICAQVCTDGKLEAPRTIKAVLDTNDLTVVEDGTQQQELASIPPENIKTTQEAMHEVAEHLKMESFPEHYEILAKTGTASYNGREAHYIISCVYPADSAPDNGFIVSLRVDNSANSFANQDGYVYEAVLREIVPFE